MEQAFIKDSDVTIGDVVTEAVSKLGENIQVGRFARFKVGEGSLS
jgi:elongation factor Ts